MTNSISEQQVKDPGVSSLSTLLQYVSVLLLADSSHDCTMITLFLNITSKYKHV